MAWNWYLLQEFQELEAVSCIQTEKNLEEKLGRRIPGNNVAWPPSYLVQESVKAEVQ